MRNHVRFDSPLARGPRFTGPKDRAPARRNTVHFEMFTPAPRGISKLVREGADFFGVTRILFRVRDRRCGAIDDST
jgi:hypothetical protein